jgi:hypothetical protein
MHYFLMTQQPPFRVPSCRFACSHVGQIVNLRPIVNRPARSQHEAA